MALDTAKHKNILIKILKDVYTDSTISTILGFKGGTAAALFYGLDRFSVDLDFDLFYPVRNGNSNGVDAEKEDYVFERVKAILENYGKLKQVRKKKFNLFYILSYDEKDINAQNIKVEINRREFGSKYDVKSFLGISMQVMIREDMAAHKMVAMYERESRTNRDIFDVWYFLQNDWPINKEIIRKRTGMSFGDFLQKCIGLVEKVNDKNILAGVGELLDEKQKAWAREHLKEDALFQLKLKLENEK